MPKSGVPFRIVLARAAQSDIREVLKWSQEKFGERAALRYRNLLKRALCDISTDPERPGSIERPELARGVRTYHLYFSRDRARSELGIVRTARHFLGYRRRGGDAIDVVRVLHDARELERHLPEDYRSRTGAADHEED